LHRSACSGDLARGLQIGDWTPIRSSAPSSFLPLGRWQPRPDPSRGRPPASGLLGEGGCPSVVRLPAPFLPLIWGWDDLSMKKCGRKAAPRAFSGGQGRRLTLGLAPRYREGFELDPCELAQFLLVGPTQCGDVAPSGSASWTLPGCATPPWRQRGLRRRGRTL
jgi:hypothetical protein